MADTLRCYRCGTSLQRLTLPLSRLDECPSCRVQLHVCRMCVHYAPGKAKECAEDDAEEVLDKRSANFCDYFAPNYQAFQGGEMDAEVAARERLAALFGDASESAAEAQPDDGAGQASSSEEAARRQAEALFKK